MFLSFRNDFLSYYSVRLSYSLYTAENTFAGDKKKKVCSLEYTHQFHLASLFNRKIIEVKIIDDEEYEKNKTFTIELGEPVLLEIGQKHGESVF